MAVTFENSASAGANGDPSFSYTAGAGSDRIILAFVSSADGSTINSVTMGAATFTEIGSVATNTGALEIRVYRLLDADIPAGSQTVTADNSVMARTCLNILEFNGVNQTTPIQTDATEQADAGTAANVTVTSAVDNIVVAGFAYPASATISPASGETESPTPETDSGGNANKMGTYYLVGETTAEMDATISASVDWIGRGISLAAAAGATEVQIFLPTQLRVLVTQEIFLPTTLKVRVEGNQIFKPTTLKVRVLGTQIFLPTQLKIVLLGQQVFLPTVLKVRVEGTQIFLPSQLKVILTTQLFLPTTLRVLVTQQIFLPTNLKVRVLGQQKFLPTALKVRVEGNQIFLPSQLSVVLFGQKIFLPTQLRVLVTQQTFLPTTLRVTVQTQIFLPTTLRVNATQQVFLPTNLKVRVLGTQIFLPTNLRVRVGNEIFLPTTLKVRVEGNQKFLPTNLRVLLISQIFLPTQLRVVVIVTTQIFLPTQLKVRILGQQVSLPTNLKVRTLANQLVMPSSLRVVVSTQKSMPTNLKVRVIGNQLNIPSTLRIKVVGQQVFLPTQLRVFLQFQIFLPTNLKVRVEGNQIFLPTTLRVILFTGNQIFLPTTLKVRAIGQQVTLPTQLRVDVPPLFSISIDDDDVNCVRKLMAQAGREAIVVHQDDIVPVFNVSGSSYVIYTDFQDIMDVQHIRLVDDIDHTGTNFLQGSIVHEKEGKIEVGLNLPAGTEEALITYATRDGLDDEAIQINIDMAKSYLQTELWRTTLDFSGSSTYSNMAKWTMCSVASYWSILAMNSSNAIQSGYNYRIAEFEIQTKLWGEGMIAETLLNKYWERSTKMINALKIFESNPEAPIFVVSRGNTRVPYNRDPNIFRTMTSMEAITIKDSKSQYAIIMKIIG